MKGFQALLVVLCLEQPALGQTDTTTQPDPCKLWSQFMFLREFHYRTADKEGSMLFRDVYKTAYIFKVGFRKKNRLHLTLVETNRNRQSEFEVDTIRNVFYLEEPDSLPYQSPPCNKPAFGLRNDIASPMLAGLVAYGILRGMHYRDRIWQNPCSMQSPEGRKHRDYNYLLFSNDSTCGLTKTNAAARRSILPVSEGESKSIFHFNSWNGFAAGFRTFIVNPSLVTSYQFFCAE